MANPDFKKIVVRGAMLAWPKLDQPYRYNSQEKRSEPCSPSAQGAAYSVGLNLTIEQAKEIHAQLVAHYKDCQTRNPRLAEFTKVFGMKKSDDGCFATFNAKKRAMSSKGEINKPPLVVDGNKQKLEDLRIYTNSMGNAVVIAYPVTDPDGNGGISLLLDKLQVTKAVYGSDDSDFEIEGFEVEGGAIKAKELVSDDPFGLPPAAPVSAPAGPQTTVMDLDDEIPF